jgi:hypothetical protein
MPRYPFGVLFLLAVAWPQIVPAAAPSVGVRDERAVAEFLRSKGANVHLDDAGRILSIEAIRSELVDDDLARLRTLRSLDALEIAGGAITDAGVAHLRSLVGLVRLYLHDIPLSDDGLAPLDGLTNLEALALQGTRITSAGLAHLKPLKQLEALNLARTRVDDDGLAHIAGLVRVETLCLERTRVSGEGLVHLKNMPRLRVLNLKECDVVDDNLETLVPHRALKMLYLHGTKVTKSHADRFKERMESIAVYFH